MALPSDLKQGTSVTILKTENVLQRFPDLVGCVAKIEKVPVHPSTWFTVKTPQNQTVKLQSTAMKLCKSGANENIGNSEENASDAPIKNR